MERKTSRLFFSFTLVGALLSLVSACSEKGTDTAGVLSETESGHTLAFAINRDIGEDGPGKVTFALTKISDGKTELYDTATANADGYAVFENAKGAYSVVATAIGQDSTADTLFGAEILRRNDIDTFYVRIGKPATVKIATDFQEEYWNGYGYDSRNAFSKGDTLCITATLACAVISDTDMGQGYTLIRNIPLFYESSFTNSRETLKQVEISRAGTFRTLGVEWNVAEGDTLYVSSKAIVEQQVFSLQYTLPETDLFDSLGNRSLDSLIVPVAEVRGDDYYNFFLDEHNDVITYEHYNDTKVSSDTTLHWVMIPHVDSTATLTAVIGNYDYGMSTSSLLRSTWDTADKDTLWERNRIFTSDSSFALSFWFKLDSLAAPLIASGSESLGFEIRRCDKDSAALCTKIYNGIDTAATDTVEYGKASVMDGERHHYSLVIHKKHLTIAIDGKTVRDTDLRLSGEFYKLESLQVSPGQVERLMLYSFGDFIRRENDKDWTRLKAWLYAFYELQKDL